MADITDAIREHLRELGIENIDVSIVRMQIQAGYGIPTEMVLTVKIIETEPWRVSRKPKVGNSDQTL